ncbi:MAG: hypothetical protein H7Z43_02300 [Clostridia bacterium]|nr:hypothetical protein [Deltaproteobacteria bacterium]
MQTSRKNRGFATMNSERQREIARKGGRAAHVKGTAHQFTSDEARAAGRKGGERVSQDRTHMAAIGRMGGRSSAGRRSKPNEADSNATSPGDPGTDPRADAGANPGTVSDESKKAS